MPTIVEKADANAALYSSATGANTKIVGGLDELKHQLAEDPDEFAVILGPAVDLEAASALADTLRITRPGISVILIRRRVETSALVEALRSGMREVVEERDLSGLELAVKRAAQVWEALHGPVAADPNAAAGKIFTVFSPKGGVGKTTTAVNLAIALAQGGTKRVCLVDLDLGFGDVAITLQLFPARTIADAVYIESGLNTVLLETLLTPHRDNVYALVAPVQPDAKDGIPASLTGKILRLLRQSFDYIVVDTAPTFDEHVLQAFDETDEILLVATLDVPTLKNLKIAVETLDLLNFPAAKRHLILNRADDKVGLTPDKVESTLKMKIAQSIPSSPQVATSTNSGDPIVSSLPRHAVSQAISSLAAQLTGATVPSNGHVAKPPPRTSSPHKRSLLRRNGR